jgi:hypothetical protein
LPETNTCVILNFDKTKLGVVSSLVTDLALLLIMLFGLLRMRIEAGGAFVLGRVLWNQVRWWQFSPAVIILKFIDVNFDS